MFVQIVEFDDLLKYFTLFLSEPISLLFKIHNTRNIDLFVRKMILVGNIAIKIKSDDRYLNKRQHLAWTGDIN